MIELSQDAAELVGELRRQHHASAKSTMAIVAGPGRGLQCLKVCFVNGAGPGQAVGISHGVTYCLQPGLSRTLDGMLLDVTRTEEGDKLTLVRHPASPAPGRHDQPPTDAVALTAHKRRVPA
jgi:hypothetical protein